MKSQDIGLLLKLVCMQKRELECQPSTQSQKYNVRALSALTGISKSQISLSLQRSYGVGLLKRDRHSGIPRVNTKGLLEFIIYGLSYVFPAKPGVITRGIATSFGAPILEGKLLSAGELVPVWSDALGTTKGQSVIPLFKSVGHAIKNDSELYAMLALVDAIRLGLPRERNLAVEMLKQSFVMSVGILGFVGTRQTFGC